MKRIAMDLEEAPCKAWKALLALALYVHQPVASWRQVATTAIQAPHTEAV